MLLWSLVGTVQHATFRTVIYLTPTVYCIDTCNFYSRIFLTAVRRIHILIALMILINFSSEILGGTEFLSGTLTAEFPLGQYEPHPEFEFPSTQKLKLGGSLPANYYHRLTRTTCDCFSAFCNARRSWSNKIEIDKLRSAIPSLRNLFSVATILGSTGY
jgi:hypothetical protein